MKNLKRAFLILMACTLALSTPISREAYAKGTDLNQENQAAILNKLDILRGTGTNYELNKKLTRAEAAAFIVRILGKEEHVKAETDQYSYTSYSDVSPDEWYAAYVGYCDKNSIINGYADKTFKPQEALSEKAFLKMLLTSVGYGYNVDFTWNNVNYYAHKAGIVDDTTYTKTVDDVITNYTRGDVIEVIFSTLQTTNKKTNLRMIQNFVDNKLISKEEAEAYGLIEDSIETEINTMNSNNQTTIEVSFNEPVMKMKLEDIQIYEKNNKNMSLNPIEITKSSKLNTYQIKLESPQRMDEDYVIELIGVIDEQGNRKDLVTYEFVGFRPDILESDLFMIGKIEPITSNMVHVYFTQPINENILSPNFYILKENDQTLVIGTGTNMQVSKLSNVRNGISIYFKNYNLKADTNYHLTIDGKAISLYGVNLKDGFGDTIKFKGITTQNEPLELLNIQPLNNRTIQLNFNKMINTTIAEQVFSYYLKDAVGTPIKILKAVVDQTTGTTVNLSIEANMLDKQKYNLMVNNAVDLTRQYSIIEKEYEFTYANVAPTQVRITSAYSVDAGTIELTLDRQLDEDSAKMISNYSIRNVTDSNYIGSPSAVYYDKNTNPYLVKLYLQQGKLLSGYKNYEISLSAGLKDAGGNPQITSEKYTFSHNNSNVTDAFIKQAIIIGNNTIKLTFNKEIAYDIKNVENANYTLIHQDENGIVSKNVPITVNYIDGTTIVLRFNQLETNKPYTIGFVQLIDYMNRITKNTSDKYNVNVLVGK